MKSYNDIEYKQRLCLDLYLPEGKDFDLFVYIHGGGLVEGSKALSREFTEAITNEGVALASLDYRMYPDARFPDYIEDCAEAVRWLSDNIGRYGSCRRILLGGSSAGGYISMMLCFDKRYLGAVGLCPTDIAAYLHDAGQPTAHFNVLKERGIDPRRVIVDETSPLYFVGVDEKYSPMTFIVADNDMPARYEQTMLTIKTLEHLGHTEGIGFILMHGTHNYYVDTLEFAELILNFVKGDRR